VPVGPDAAHLLKIASSNSDVELDSLRLHMLGLA
jgi:hypothetical protein